MQRIIKLTLAIHTDSLQNTVHGYRLICVLDSGTALFTLLLEILNGVLSQTVSACSMRVEWIDSRCAEWTVHSARVSTRIVSFLTGRRAYLARQRPKLCCWSEDRGASEVLWRRRELGRATAKGEHAQAKRLCLARIKSLFISLLVVLTRILGSVPVLYTSVSPNV